VQHFTRFQLTACSHGSSALAQLLVELGVRTPGGLFLGVWYAGGIYFRRFRTPSLPIFCVISGLLEATKMYKLF